ncbi:MAG: structural protein MipA [Sphingorhabdus sp.]|nr:structural protein MipA [Sphingorhabdus sp.]
MRLSIIAAGLSAALIAVPALAQQAPANIPPLEDTVYAGDWVTIGGGVGVSPSYEGSDDYVFFPVPAAAGSVGGVNFQPKGTGIGADIINDPDDAKVGFVFGPVARVRLDRTRQIKDDVVKRLGKLDTAVELGAQAGIQYSGIITPYDTLSATVDVVWDVAGAHKGRVITPSVSFLTPVSRGAAVVLSVSADHVDDNFAEYYYSISPSGSLASGLPTYNAKGGFQSVGANLLGTYDLDGDLTNGGFAIFGLAGYSRILGNFADSPIVADRGSADQFIGGIGIGYTF